MFLKRVLPTFILMVPFVILAMFFLDQQLAQFTAKPELTWLKQSSREITDIALAEYYFALALGGFLLAKFLIWYRKKSEAFMIDRLAFFQRWSINLFSALFVSGVLVHIFKNAFGRLRPHKSADFAAFEFQSFNFHWDWHSFPSGHAQVIFTVATLFSVAFPKVRFLWFTLAALVALTRVTIQYHYLSDVIAGAWVGYAGAHLSMYLLRKTKASIFQF